MKYKHCTVISTIAQNKYYTVVKHVASEDVTRASQHEHSWKQTACPERAYLPHLAYLRWTAVSPALMSYTQNHAQHFCITLQARSHSSCSQAGRQLHQLSSLQ